MQELCLTLLSTRRIQSRSSEQRRLHATLKSQYPSAVDAIDSGELWASGAWGEEIGGVKCEGGEWVVQTAKAPHKMQLLLVCEKPLFFREGDDGFIFPCLRLLHCLPDLLPKCHVDLGAIKHVISGAVVMAPGIYQMDTVKAGDAVTIFAEDHQYALAIGVLLKDSDDIFADKKGPAIEVILPPNFIMNDFVISPPAHTSPSARTNNRWSTGTHRLKYTQTHAHTCVHIILTHTLICVYVDFIYIRIYIHIYIFVYIYIYISKYTYV